MNNILYKSEIKFLIVHCSDTNNDFTVEDIHKMHLSFGWNGIGYHKVIDQKGKIFNGRPEYWVGAHVKGFNKESLGVCLIGKHDFSNKQFKSLEIVLSRWKRIYKDAKILGHKDVVKTSKTCPNFNVTEWTKNNPNLNF